MCFLRLSLCQIRGCAPGLERCPLCGKLMPGRGRELQPGEPAETDFLGRTTLHVIRERREGVRNCQSGILFRVEPPLMNGFDRSNPYCEGPNSWYDADWFRPPIAAAQKELF